MAIHDVAALARGLHELAITPGMREEAAAPTEHSWAEDPRAGG
jgi:hypothetical protein